MKLFFALVFVLLLNGLHAQQVFQGSIVYTVKTPEEKQNVELLILYGPNKIKLKFKEKEDYDKTYLIVDLDSSKFYTVNADSKTFQSKQLAEITTEQTAAPKIIAGFNTIPVNVGGSGFSGILGFAGSSTFFEAPDLYFPIPKKHAGIPELIMIQNNHIVLGAEIRMGIPGMVSNQMPDSVADKMKVSIQATKITPQNIDIAEFNVPYDFTLQSKNYFSMTDTAYAVDSTELTTTDSMFDDSTTVITETLEVPPPVKKKTSTGTKPSTPKKTSPTKTEAIKPKNTQTKS
jgi:hypothetical protein